MVYEKCTCVIAGMFLSNADYKAAIKDNVLTAIIENDSAVRDTAETAAQAEMTGYLAARYDTVAIFAATGIDRDAAVVRFLVDMTLYNLYSRISPDQVPALRKERYDAAINWLKMVAKQQINPDLPAPEDLTKEEVRYGSNEARNNHF